LKEYRYRVGLIRQGKEPPKPDKTQRFTGIGLTRKQAVKRELVMKAARKERTTSAEYEELPTQYTISDETREATLPEFITSVSYKQEPRVSPAQSRLAVAETRVKGFIGRKILPEKRISLIEKGVYVGAIPYSKVTLTKEFPAFTAGVVGGQLRDIKEKPFKQVALVGVGVGVGLGIKGVGVGVKAFERTKVAPILLGKGKRITKFTEPAIAGTAGALTAVYATDVAMKAAVAPTTKAKGAVIGVAAKDLTLVGLGTVKGMKAFEKGYDLIRTRKAIEIPAKKIVAPEYPKQTYPAIRRGQTAGQLRAEFYKPIKAIGEIDVKARGFTASPAGWKKKTKIAKGGSELYGGYVSPKLSPKFLQIEKTKTQLYGYKDILAISEPTAIRTTFAEVKLAKGVSPEQRRLRKLDVPLLRQFGGGRIGKRKYDLGEPTLKRGKAYVPFIKTEKEAVALFGTPTIRTGKEFYFKMAGRRVLIEQRKALAEPSVIGKRVRIGRKKVKVEELGEVSKRYSYAGRTSRRGALAPPSVSSLRSPKSARSILKPSSYKYPISRRARPSRYRYGVSLPSSAYRGLSSAGLSSLRSPPSSSYSYSARARKKQPPIVPPFYFKPKKKRKKTVTFKKQREDIALVESFTARQLGITRKIRKKDLQKEAAKIKTGLGIRARPIIVK